MSRKTAPGSTPEGRFGRFVVETVLLVVVAVTVAALLRMFVVQAFVVPSGSMLPTIEQTDRIVVSKLSDPARGDVVVFKDPGGWLPPGEQSSKRTDLLGRALEQRRLLDLLLLALQLLLLLVDLVEVLLVGLRGMAERRRHQQRPVRSRAEPVGDPVVRLARGG